MKYILFISQQQFRYKKLKSCSPVVIACSTAGRPVVFIALGRCYCGNCPLGGKNCTIKEEREMALIEKNLEYCDKGFWIVGYPWIKDISKLPDNIHYAYKTLVQTEKRLRRKSLYEVMYHEQIQDMVNRKVARKLTKTKILHYKGPV